MKNESLIFAGGFSGAGARGAFCDNKGVQKMIKYYDIFLGNKWIAQTTDLNKAIEFCFVGGYEIKVFSI